MMPREKVILDAEDPDKAWQILQGKTLAEETAAVIQDSRQCLLLVLNIDTKGRSGQSAYHFVAELRGDSELENTPLIITGPAVGKAELAYLGELLINSYIVLPLKVKEFEDKLRHMLILRSNPPAYVQRIIEGHALLNKYQQENDKSRAQVAEQAFLSALKMKRSARALASLGQAKVALGKTAEAMQCFQESIDENPIYLKPYNLLSELESSLGESEDALSTLKEAANISPLNPKRQIRIGELELLAGNAGEAHRAFLMALCHDSLSATEITQIYLDHGKPEAAENLLRSFIENSKLGTARDAEVYNRLGIALRRQNQISEAILMYETALKLNGKNAGVHFNLGKAHEAAGDTQAATISYQTALTLDSTLEEAKQALDALAAQAAT
jgi:tetratricopeptide (TPR) repeat protein